MDICSFLTINLTHFEDQMKSGKLINLYLYFSN